MLQEVTTVVAIMILMHNIWAPPYNASMDYVLVLLRPRAHLHLNPGLMRTTESSFTFESESVL